MFRFLELHLGFSCYYSKAVLAIHHYFVYFFLVVLAIIAAVGNHYSIS